MIFSSQQSDEKKNKEKIGRGPWKSYQKEQITLDKKRKFITQFNGHDCENLLSDKKLLKVLKLCHIEINWNSIRIKSELKRKLFK